MGEVPLTLLAWGGAGLDPITSIICTDVETAAVLSFRPEAPPVSSVDPLPLPPSRLHELSSDALFISGTQTKDCNPWWKWKWSHSIVSDSLQPCGPYSPWNSPGQNTGVSSLSLLQGIFPTQESNPGLPHCRWILYQLSYQRSHGELGVKVTDTKRPYRPQLGGQAGWAGAGLLLRQSGEGCPKPVHPPGSSPQGCSPSVRVPPSPGCPDGCWAPGPGGPFVSALCALPCQRGLTRQEQLPLWVRWQLLVLCGWGRLSFRELRAWDGGRR